MSTFRASMLIGATLLVGVPVQLNAAIITVVGNTCPADPLGTFNRQYKVDDATDCVFDPQVVNLTGTNAEADLYLNPFYGTGWVGLGQTTAAGTGITDLTVTCPGGCDGATSGSFSYVGPFGQIAFGIKDGGTPKWALFVMPAGDFASAFSFLSRGGSYSHGALFGRDPELQFPEVPEPATLLLLGTGVAALAARRRRNSLRS